MKTSHSLSHALKDALRRRIGNWLRQSSRDLDLAGNRIAAEASALFLIENAPRAKSRNDKFDLLRDGIEAVGCEGLFCEFGVYRGTTINHIASLTNAIVHGFDSFDGLPEDWRGGFERGTFRCDQLPAVRSNVELHKGLFEESLPEFLVNHPEQVAFIHVDCDLYSSTVTVLELLQHRIVPGTVIQFDEFFNYPGWQKGEYRAFAEFCEKHQLEVEWLGYVRSDEQVLLQVRSVGRSADQSDHSGGYGSQLPTAGR